MLLTFEDFCSEDVVFRGCGSSVFAPVFGNMLHLLFSEGILTEDAILTWAEEKARYSLRRHPCCLCILLATPPS